jgi:hypothetical protein
MVELRWNKKYFFRQENIKLTWFVLFPILVMVAASTPAAIEKMVMSVSFFPSPSSHRNNFLNHQISLPPLFCQIIPIVPPSILFFGSAFVPAGVCLFVESALLKIRPNTLSIPRKRLAFPRPRKWPKLHARIVVCWIRLKLLRLPRLRM